MSHVISIDIGSTSITALVYDTEHSSVVTMATAPTDAKLETSGPGQKSEWSAEKIYEITIDLLEILNHKYSRHKYSRPLSSCDIAGIIVTGQQHGVVLLDRNKPEHVLSPFIGWMDQRGMLRFKDSPYTITEELNRRLIQTGQEELGCCLATGYAAVSLFALNKEKGLPKNCIASFITEYINLRLTGNRRLYTDSTMAASSGVFNVFRNRWSESAIEALELPLALFPEPVPVGERIGYLSQEAAKQTGLSEGIPVFQGLGDNQASLLGCFEGSSPILSFLRNRTGSQSNFTVLNYGTGTQVTIYSDQYKYGSNYETRPFPTGGYIFVRAEPAGGRAYARLRQFFIEVGRDLFNVPESEDLYERMNRLAEQISEDVIGPKCNPSFFPRRSTTPGMKDGPLDSFASFTHISDRNFTPGFMVKSLLEGMAENSYLDWNILNRIKNGNSDDSPLLLYGSGNLLRKCRIFRMILEHRFQCPVICTSYSEEAAVGAARCIS